MKAIIKLEIVSFLCSVALTVTITPLIVHVVGKPDKQTASTGTVTHSFITLP